MGNTTNEDLLLIQTRQTTTVPIILQNIFGQNKDVDAHNAKILKLLVKRIINIEAVNSKTDSQTQRLTPTNFSKFTAGLPGILQIEQGTRVMLIKNPPVTKRAVYKQPNDPHSYSVQGSLWH